MIMFAVHPRVLMRLQNHSNLGMAWVQQQILEALGRDEAIYIGDIEDFYALPEETANKIKELIYQHNWRKIYLFGEDEHEEAQQAMSSTKVGGRRITKR